MGHFAWIYIRQQKRPILTCLLFCIIFSVIFILYQLPVSAIVYPLLLCMVAGLVIMGIDMVQAWRRYVALQQTLDAVGLELDQELLPGKETVYFQTTSGEGSANGRFQATGGEGKVNGHLQTISGEGSTNGRFQATGGEGSNDGDFQTTAGEGSNDGDFQTTGGERNADGYFQATNKEKNVREHVQTSEGDGCAWELLLEMLQSEMDSERGDWEARIYREMVRQLLMEQRRRQDIMQIRHQDTVDYYTTWVHQIKTPIAAMGLILQQEDTEASRRLSEELQRIEQYVDMVLTYLRLDSNDTDYLFAQVDLDKLLRGCIKKYAGQFIRRHLALDYQNLNCQVLTDEKWLAFVVEQILSNALKYTREGSVSIYLESPCTLCIRDTGIGIAPEDLPRIFEKGYTGYNGRSDKKATGLGLYLCRQICDRLKSTITAESVPGEGTIIRIGLGREVLGVE